jgi:hypothetical protein
VESCRSDEATSIARVAARGLSEGHRTRRYPKGRILDDRLGLRIGETNKMPISVTKLLRSSSHTIKAVKKGESPQNTEVFAGAFIPNANVPERMEN